ncbi:MAG: hypothetical protein KKD75_06345 [Nanoarchaeota archaeon]|nr:hypothetical protein [Nanoarchaeota archaeon]MBU1632651.1 hypothetical protein [Nanoarchaeota archaeon]
MVSFDELKARVKEFLRFSKQEFVGLLVAIVVTGFIFSFRDWGDESFSLVIGLTNLLLVFIIAAISFFFRLSCQKVYALSQGYKAEFKVWWVGLIIALVIALISAGRIPLVIIGSVIASFMIKQRLGEYRYGFSHSQNGVIAFWGILGNMILALIFATGLFIFPQSYFFSKGLLLNLIMGFCSLLPLPQLDGLKIFFGSRTWYFIGIGTVLLAAILLLSRTKVGLIIAIFIGATSGIIAILIGSEV